jgi:hypothetical protein
MDPIRSYSIVPGSIQRLGLQSSGDSSRFEKKATAARFSLIVSSSAPIFNPLVRLITTVRHIYLVVSLLIQLADYLELEGCYSVVLLLLILWLVAMEWLTIVHMRI